MLTPTCSAALGESLFTCRFFGGNGGPDISLSLSFVTVHSCDKRYVWIGRVGVSLSPMSSSNPLIVFTQWECHLHSGSLDPDWVCWCSSICSNSLFVICEGFPNSVPHQSLEKLLFPNSAPIANTCSWEWLLSDRQDRRPEVFQFGYKAGCVHKSWGKIPGAKSGVCFCSYLSVCVLTTSEQ